jgi:hypothetical protein
LTPVFRVSFDRPSASQTMPKRRTAPIPAAAEITVGFDHDGVAGFFAGGTDARGVAEAEGVASRRTGVS